MGAALEVVTGRATAPGATFTAVTPNTGNSLTVRNANPDAPVAIVQAWAKCQVAGTMRIRSPRLHDNVQGMRFDINANNVIPLLPWGLSQALYPQDNLTVELTGSAVGGQIEEAAMLVYYGDLPGIDAQLATWDQIAPRIRNIIPVENTLALGVTGDYTGEEAINAEFDLLKANTYYALLGYIVDTVCAAVRWRGADTGNLGVGGPGDPLIRQLTKDWFVLLAQAFQLPMIPVFNASNKTGVLLDGVQDQAGADPTVTHIYAELG